MKGELEVGRHRRPAVQRRTSHSDHARPVQDVGCVLSGVEPQAARETLSEQHRVPLVRPGTAPAGLSSRTRIRPEVCRPVRQPGPWCGEPVQLPDLVVRQDG